MLGAIEILTLQLLRQPALSEKQLIQCVTKHSLPQTEIDTNLNLLLEHVNQSARTHYTLENFKEAQRQAHIIQQRCMRLDIKMIAFHDPLFPSELKAIPNNPPILLYARGDLNALQTQPRVAIVGSRESSNPGITAAHHYSKFLSEQGYAIVSGLAKGCDTAAHQGCLGARGVTIAVLANGLDDASIYPHENRPLARRIIENNGLLLSEYPPQTPSQASQFIARNRIQSGLSASIVIIECASRGGTMATAQHAKKQKVPIACLTYSDNTRAELAKRAGNKKLITEDAAAEFRDEQELFTFLQQIVNKKNAVNCQPSLGPFKIFFPQ